MPETPDLLVGDTERRTAAADLRAHYEAGRLTLEELEGRLDHVNAARTESDLREALRQLPEKQLPTLSPRDTRWRSLGLQYGLINLVVILVWLISGANGGFWPKWVFLGTVIMFVRRVSGRRARHREALPSRQRLLP